MAVLPDLPTISPIKIIFIVSNIYPVSELVKATKPTQSSMNQVKIRNNLHYSMAKLLRFSRLLADYI